MAGAGRVVAVSRDGRHRFSKQPVESVQLLAGLGVEGDAHAGVTVQHRSRRRWHPELPNLRQVHLLASELLETLRAQGFALQPGDVGENVLTSDVDLLALPTGARLRLGLDAVVRVTGLRNPCVQLDRFADGLMPAMLDRAPDGSLLRLAGVMAVVQASGSVRAGDGIEVQLPDGEPEPLAPV